MFDTADLYGQGHSEEVLGEALHDRRHQAVVCTKVGYVMAKRLRFLGRLKSFLRPVLKAVQSVSSRAGDSIVAARASAISQDFSPGYIDAAVHSSLRRLSMEHIDLLLLHSPPVDVESEPVIAVLEKLKASGKIGAFGISVRDPLDADTFLNWQGISALQMRFEPDHAGLLGLVVERAERLGVGIIAREVFSGVAIKDPGARQQALRSTLAQRGIDVALVGTSNIDHLRENLAAL